MAGGVSVKMGVDVTQFKRGINEAKSVVRTLDEQLKTNEKQLKLNGDAELYMKNKSSLLKSQLDAQRKVVVNTHKALEEMKSKGVDPSSSAYQKLEESLAKAQGKFVDIQTKIKEVETGSADAKKETNEMNSELKAIGKGVSFKNVSDGLKQITEKLKNGAEAALNFGKKIAESAKDATGWADDVLTRAIQNGVDAETIQRMDNVAKYIDTDVDTILSAKNRLANNKKGLGELLGIEGTEGMSLEDQFWKAGEAIMAMTDEAERADKAQDVFGKSWKDLVPLFAAGREEYERLMNSQNVLTNEQVKKLGEADDEFQRMEIELQRLKTEFWAENSQTVIDLLQWLIDNKDGVLTALTVIGGGFAALKIGELASNIGQVVSGFKTLIGTGAGAGAAGAGGGAGTALAGAAGKIGGGLLGQVLPFVAGSATVTVAAVLPAAINQLKNIDETREKQEELEREAARMAEEGNENADFVSRSAAATGLVRDASGAEARNFLGMGYTQMSDEYGDLLMGLKSRKGAEMAKLALALRGQQTSTGDDAWLALQRYWNGNGEGMDPFMVDALLKTVTDALVDQSKRGLLNPAASVGPARELPAGWVYANGGAQRVDENGKLMYGNDEYFKSTGYMDAAGFAKWFAEENAKYSAIYGGDWGGRDGGASQGQEQATRQQNEILASLPAGIANSISRIRVVMDGTEVGYLVAPAVSQMIARGMTQ